MKHIISCIASLLLLMLLIPACSEEEIMTFDGRVAGIYLQRNSSYTMDGQGNISSQKYADSTSLSFADSTEEATCIITQLTVKIMGNVVDYDRPFTLKVDEQASTAVRGTNFDFNESDCVIPAGAAQTYVPITIYRTPDLAEDEKKHFIEFYLEDNDFFTVELEQYKDIDDWAATGDTLCGSRYTIIFSEIYTVPFYYEIFGPDYFGDWSVSKEKLINSLMGWTHQDWDNGTVQLGALGYAAQLTHNHLQEAADSGNPILDDDGSYMQLTGSYVVDYSAYE